MHASRFAELGVATTLEGASGIGLLDGPWIRVVPGSRIAGPARSALCGPGDCLAYHWLLERLEPGDVIVLTRPEPDGIAFWGEVMAVQARALGVAGLLVDGAVRDVDEMASLGFPVWARSISPAGPTNELQGEIDVPVTIGGVTIRPGDLLVLDGDGVVAVQRDRCDEVLAGAERRHAWEQSLMPRLAAGELTVDVLGLRRPTS